MGDLRRVTTLTSPPIIGRRYLVPTVRYDWRPGGGVATWPVFPTRHEDSAHLDYPWPHYHIDPRFVSNGHWRRVENYDSDFRTGLEWAQSHPLMQLKSGWCGVKPSAKEAATQVEAHPKIVWRPRVCQREIGDYSFSDAPTIRSLQAALAGQKATTSRTGWVCPHKQFPLGSIPALNGVITCPLHGLRLRASDGEVMPEPATERAKQIHAELANPPETT